MGYYQRPRILEDHYGLLWLKAGTMCDKEMVMFVAFHESLNSILIECLMSKAMTSLYLEIFYSINFNEI